MATPSKRRWPTPAIVPPTWPSPETCTAVAVRSVGCRIELLAPFGVSDLLSLIVSPTPAFADKLGIYLLNSVNPFRIEGQKTIVVEMMDYRDWNPPDWIVLPGGNLGNTSAFGKALRELKEWGLIDRMPRLAVIQAEGSAPFYDLMHTADRSKLRAVEQAAHELAGATDADKAEKRIAYRDAQRSFRMELRSGGEDGNSQPRQPGQE